MLYPVAYFAPEIEIFIVVRDNPADGKPTVLGCRDKDDEENAQHERWHRVHHEQHHTRAHVEGRTVLQGFDHAQDDAYQVGQHQRRQAKLQRNRHAGENDVQHRLFIDKTVAEIQRDNIFQPQTIAHQKRLIEAVLAFQGLNNFFRHALIAPFVARPGGGAGAQGATKAHEHEFLLDRAAWGQVDDDKADEGDSQQGWDHEEYTSEKIQAHEMLVNQREMTRCAAMA